MKCVWSWKCVSNGEENQEGGHARANILLGAGIIVLVLLPLVILYTPHIFGQSLEVLYPFVSETYIENVPFRYQSKNYYCGPASLEMVYAFYGTDIYQYYVAEVARTNLWTGTGGWDILRAGHFSNLSSSIGFDDPYFNGSGYPSRDLGYAAFYWSSGNQNFTEAINYLYDLIDQGYPIIVAVDPAVASYPDVPSALSYSGHAMVVVGYGSTTYMVLDAETLQMVSIVNHWLTVHDPWNSIAWGGVGGPNRTIEWSEFNATWSAYNYSMYFIHPLMVNVTGVSVNATSTFVVTANITYPSPAPFPGGMYPASTFTATIDLPPSFSLALGENLTKTVGPGGIITADSSSSISWNVTAPSEGSSYEVEVEAEGRVSGVMWIGPPGMQPALVPVYNYTDRIGGFGLGSVTVNAPEREPTETPAETTGEATLDSTGAAKTSFAPGETVLLSADVSNVGASSQAMVIVVQLKDPELRVLAPSYLSVSLSPGQSLTPSLGFLMPTTGYAAGTWTATIMVFDAWPALGGVPIGDPVTVTFTVTS